MTRLVRSLLATAVGGAAKSLALASELLEHGATALRPPTVEEVPGGGVQAVSPAGPVVQPAPAPSLDDETHRREPETHAAALAERPAAEVVAEIGSLSTDELRALTEYEVAHRNRKTVLQAIERALAP